MPHPIRGQFFTRRGWSEFGAWRRSGSHKGFDYYVPEGDPIYGTGNGGRVASIGYNMNPVSGFGHSVTVVYPGGRKTIDAHMLRRTKLAVGQSVNAGTVLGYVGKSGNAWNVSVNAIFGGKYRKLRHVHHEVTVSGRRVDPIQLYGASFSGFPPEVVVSQISRDWDDMRLVRRKEGSPEWSLFHPTFSGPDELQRGYYVITDRDEADDWARLLYKGSGSEQVEPRAAYVRMQKSARKAYANASRKNL